MTRGVEIYVRPLQRGTVDRFWKAELRGETLVTVQGDVSAPGEAETTVYKSRMARIRLSDRLLDLGNQGYVSISPSELKTLLRGSKSTNTKARPKKLVQLGKSTASASEPEMTPTRLPPRARGRTKKIARPQVAVGSPYRDPMTTPSVFVLSLGPSGQNAKEVPRASSGGRPILQPVALFTEIIDEVSAEPVVRTVRGLGPRHLALCVLFRNETLDAMMEPHLSVGEIKAADLYQRAATAGAILWRVPKFLPSLGLLWTSFASSLLGYMAMAMRPRRSSRPRFLAAPGSVRNLGTRPR